LALGEDDAVTTGERHELLSAAEALERLAAVSTGGQWRLGGLLATRPEIIAHREDGTTEHVAEARADSARWIATLSPMLARPLADWLRSAARADPIDAAAMSFARALRHRLSASARANEAPMQ
jgi:hypothetical protein